MMLIDFINQIIDDSTNVNHIQLVGQGGSSKTFQLLNVYNCLSKLDNTIPIYIPLVEAITKNGYSLFRFIERHYLDVEVEYDLDLMAKRILDLFTDNEQYKFVLLLDGYNEVVSNFEFRTDAHGVNLEIQELNALPNVTIIISTRYVLTGKTFPDYCIVDMLPLNQDQIDALLPNRSAFDERLNGILRIPFYLDVYRRLCKEDNYDSVLNPISSEGELLQYYYFTYLPKKFLDENKLDSDNLYYEQFLFCLNSLLPKIAYFLHQNNTMRITEKQIDDCFISIDNFHAESWNIMDLIRNYLVPTGIMFQTDNDETEKYYIFSHEYLKDVMFSKYWTFETDKETISPDVLKLRLTHSEMCYIGDIFGEYKSRYILKKDSKEISPIESRISQYRGKFNDFAVQSYLSTCVEIMKKKRYHITADFSNLDLSLCDFTNVECPNCNFSGSLIKSSTFIASAPISISLTGTRMWSDGCILINFYKDGFVAYNLQNGKEMYRRSKLFNKDYGIPFQYNTSYIYVDSDAIYINDYHSIYKFDTYTGELIDYRICIYNGKNTGLSLFEKAINKIYQKHCDHKSIKYYTINKPYYHFSDVCIVYDSFNSVFCYVYNCKELIFFNESFDKIGEFSLEKYGSLYDHRDSPNSFTQFGWYIAESESGEVLFFLKLSIKEDSIEVVKKYELELNKIYKPESKEEDLEIIEGDTELYEFATDEEKMKFEEERALAGESKSDKNNSGYVRLYRNELIECIKVIDEKHAVVLCNSSNDRYFRTNNHSIWYYIDLYKKEESCVESEKWVRYCDNGTISFINNGCINNIVCFFHSKSNRNITYLNYLSGKQGDIDLKTFFGENEDRFIVGSFDFGIIIESDHKICVFDKEFRWQRTLLKNSPAIIEYVFFEDDTLNCCIKKLKSQNGIDEKHFRDLYRYNINDKSVKISTFGFGDYYLIQDVFYKKTGIRIDEVVRLSYEDGGTVSLQTPIGEDEKTTLGDTLPDNNTPEQEFESKENQRNTDELIKVINNLIKGLEEKTRGIIKLLFGIGTNHERLYSVEEVAEIYNLSVNEVKETKSRVLFYLRTKGYELSSIEGVEKSKDDVASATQNKNETNGFIDFRYAIENGIPDQDSPSNFIKLVSWMAQAKKPIIATRSRIIAYGFAKKLSSKDVNALLAKFSFGNLYPRNLQDSCLIFALDTGMSVKEWKALYRKYAKKFKENSNVLIPEAKIGTADLSERDFYKYIVECFRLPSESQIESISLDIIDSIQSEENVKKSVKAVSKLLNDNKSESSKMFSHLLLDKEDKTRISDIICHSIFTKDNDESEIDRKISSILNAYFRDGIAISSMYSKIVSIIEENCISKENLSLVLGTAIEIPRDQINASLEKCFPEIKSTFSKSACSEVSVYSTISNHLTCSNDEIKSLFSKLQKNASSSLTLEALNEYVSKSSQVNSTINYTALYHELHVHFAESFSLNDLFKIVQRYSETENAEKLVTPHITEKAVKPALQNVTKEACSLLSERIGNEKSAVYESFYDKFYKEVFNHFSETRYLKRRYLYKWLFFFLKDNIENFVKIEKKLIALNKNQFFDEDESAYRKVTRKEYLAAADKTLIKGLKKLCTASQKPKEEDNSITKNDRNKEESNYSYRNLSKDNMLSYDDLTTKYRITISKLFFDFSNFLSFYNNINGRFIKQFNVSAYCNETALAKGYAVVTINLNYKSKKDSFDISYHKESFVDYFSLDNLTSEEVDQRFIDELKGCIREIDKLKPENIEWLLAVAKAEKYDEDLIAKQKQQLEDINSFIWKYELELSHSSIQNKPDHRCFYFDSENQRVYFYYNKRKYIEERKKSGSTLIEVVTFLADGTINRQIKKLEHMCKVNGVEETSIAAKLIQISDLKESMDSSDSIDSIITHYQEFRFSTYATWWIRQSITRAIADQANAIRHPVHLAEDKTKLKKATAILLHHNGCEPSATELAEELNWPVQKVKDIQYYSSQQPISLETPIGEENDSLLGDFIADDRSLSSEEIVCRSILHDKINELLKTITDREALVIELRFGLNDKHPHTLEEVGTILGVTRERVRQIEVKALRKLRHPLRIKQLLGFE